MFISHGARRALAAAAGVSVLVVAPACGSSGGGLTSVDADGAAPASGTPSASVVGATSARSGPIAVGMHYDEVRAIHPDFPEQSEAISDGTGKYTFFWEDGEYVFDSEGYVIDMGHWAGPAKSATESRDPDGVSGAGAGTEAGAGSGSAGAAAIPGWVADLPGVAIEVYRPVSADGSVQPGWRVEDAGGHCESSAGSNPSYSAVEAGTVQCSTQTAMSAQDCWPDQTGYAALCLRGAGDKVLYRISSPSALAGRPAGPSPVPVEVRLEDGYSCGYMSGGTQSSFEEAGVLYTTRGGCTGGGRRAVVASSGTVDTMGIYTSGGQTVIDVTTDFETTVPMRVTTVAFLGTA